MRVNAGLPAAVAAGDSEVIAGGALSDGSTVTGGLVAASVKTLFRKQSKLVLARPSTAS